LAIAAAGAGQLTSCPAGFLQGRFTAIRRRMRLGRIIEIQALSLATFRGVTTIYCDHP